MPSINPDRNPNFRESQISRIYAVGLSQSLQGQDAIRVELESGHGLILDRNGKISISGVNTSLDKDWNIVRVDEDVLELISSSAEAQGFNEIVGSGILSLTETLSTLTDRFLEGQLFRVLSVKEVSENQYEVTGLEYNYSKFSAVDKKGVVRPPSLPIPPQADMSIPEAPDGLLLFDLTV